MTKRNRILMRQIAEYDLQNIVKFLANHKKARWLKLLNRIINRCYYENYEYGEMIPW